MRKIAIAILMSLALGFGLKAVADTSALGTTAWVSPNPYAAVNWSTCGHYKGDLHTHTNESDGSRTPAELIDCFKALGYGVLAITDHDYYKKQTTWPWKKFGRSPVELGMVAIEGSEISRELHHIISLYSNYACNDSGGTDALETVALNTIRDRGGIAFFAHPSQYNFSLLWYKTYFEMYPREMLVGMEVKGDRKKWDDLLTWLMPERPIWGFGNSDTHDAPTAWTFNTFPLSGLTDANVRKAIVDGQFTFSQNATEAPRITAINVGYGRTAVRNAATGQKQSVLYIDSITVAADDPEAVVKWFSCGRMIHVGPTINVTANPLASRYVRAEVTPKPTVTEDPEPREKSRTEDPEEKKDPGENDDPPINNPGFDGRITFTQPFAVPIKGDDTKPALFDPMVHVAMPANAVFADDFELGVFDGDRYTKSGNGEVAVAQEASDNHALKFVVAEGSNTTEAILKNIQVGDCTVETDIRHDAPVNYNYASLRLRRASSNTYYEVRFERRDIVRIVRRVAGVTTTLGVHEFPDNAMFMDGKPHRLKVELAGGTIRVFYDGNQILDRTDPDPLPAGGVSLSAWSARVTFDNLWIFE